MDLAIPTIPPLSRLETRQFALLASCEVAAIILGLATQIAVIPLIIPAALLVVGLASAPIAAIALLLALCSVAVHVSFVTADILVIAALAVRWAVDGRNARVTSPSFAGTRRWAWLLVVWTTLVFLLRAPELTMDSYVAGVAVRLVCYLGVYVLVADLLSTAPKGVAGRLLRWLWLCTAIVAAIALIQHFVLGKARVPSILEPHHAHLGNYAVLGMMVGGVIAVLVDRPFTRVAGIATLVLSMLALLVSETRSDYTGVLLGGVLYAFMRGVRGIVVVGVLAVAIVGSGVANSILKKQEEMTFQEEDAQETQWQSDPAKYDASSVDRVLIWLGVLSLETDATPDHVLIGHGPGSVPEVLRPHLRLHQVYLRSPGATAIGAHNNVLQILVELGAAGLILFVLLLGSVIRGMWRASRGNPRARHAAVVVIAGTVALIASGATQETFYGQPAMGSFFGLYMVFIAMIAVIISRDGETV